MKPIQLDYHVWYKGRIIKPVSILPKGVTIRTDRTALVSGQMILEMVRWSELDEFDPDKWRHMKRWASDINEMRNNNTRPQSCPVEYTTPSRAFRIYEGLWFVYNRYNIGQYLDE